MRLAIVRLQLLVSSLLLVVAGGWSVLRGLDVAALVVPSLATVALGAGCGVGLAVTLPLVTTRWARRALLLRGLRRAWDSLESGLGPALGMRDVVVLAICSAVSEEIFFRGVLQPEIGLVASSTLFGLLHPLGAAYMVWAGTIGAGLGLLGTASGGLAAPIAAHGTYNLIALAYLRRRGARDDLR